MGPVRGPRDRADISGGEARRQGEPACLHGVVTGAG